MKTAGKRQKIPLSFSKKWIYIFIVFSVLLITGNIGVKVIEYTMRKDLAVPTATPKPSRQLFPPKLDVRQYTDMARENLSVRLNIKADDVSVTRTEEKNWPDSCLGCANPQSMCSQVITPGYLIHLEYKGNTFVYHAGSNHVVMCADEG